MDPRIELLNDIANRPEVLDGCAPGYAGLNLAEFFNEPNNIMLGDERGVLLFAYSDRTDSYEMHYLFTHELRGQAALKACRAAIKTVFTRTGAAAIFGATPRENRAARAMNRALGARPIGVSQDSQGRACINYILERATWAISSAD